MVKMRGIENNNVEVNFFISLIVEVRFILLLGSYW